MIAFFLNIPEFIVDYRNFFSGNDYPIRTEEKDKPIIDLSAYYDPEKNCYEAGETWENLQTAKEKQKIKKTDPENNRCTADGFRYCSCCNSGDGSKCRTYCYFKAGKKSMGLG